MLVNGKKLSTLNEEIVVLPRSGIDPETGEEVQDLVFKFRPVKDFDVFNKLVKEPQPEYIAAVGQKVAEPDYNSPDYKTKMIEYASKQTHYIVIHSILATPGLVFELVVLDDPSTWTKLNEEFLKSGLAIPEINKLYEAALKVNSLSDRTLDAARERFLAGEKARVQKSLSLQAAQPST